MKVQLRSMGTLATVFLLTGCTVLWDVPKVPRYNARTGQCEEGYVYLPPHDVKKGSKVVDCSRRHRTDDDGVRDDGRDVRKGRSGLGDQHRVRRDVGLPTPGEEGD